MFHININILGGYNQGGGGGYGGDNNASQDYYGQQQQQPSGYYQVEKKLSCLSHGIIESFLQILK